MSPSCPRNGNRRPFAFPTNQDRCSRNVRHTSYRADRSRSSGSRSPFLILPPLQRPNPFRFRYPIQCRSRSPFPRRCQHPFQNRFRRPRHCRYLSRRPRHFPHRHRSHFLNQRPRHCRYLCLRLYPRLCQEAKRLVRLPLQDSLENSSLEHCFPQNTRRQSYKNLPWEPRSFRNIKRDEVGPSHRRSDYSRPSPYPM